MATRTNPMHAVAYRMLTESTGTHMLDSGGGSGRHWQRNAKLTLDDMTEQPRATIDNWYGSPDLTIQVFHYLSAWCDPVNADHPARVHFAELESEYPDDNWFALADRFRDSVSDIGGTVTNGWNTYNWETLISQVLQGFAFTHPEAEGVYLCVQVHGGADVRGGYTRPYILCIDADGDDPEYPEGCFLAGMSDADIYCAAEDCDWGYMVQGGDVIDREGCYTGRDFAEDIDWEHMRCPKCGTADSIRADMQEPSL